MFDVDRKHGTIFITHPEPFNKDRNRVANIEKDDKGDVWLVEINKDYCSLVIALPFDGRKEEDVSNLTKQIMLTPYWTVYCG